MGGFQHYDITEGWMIVNIRTWWELSGNSKRCKASETKRVH